MPHFQPAPKLTQEDIEFVVQRARKRILRYLEKRGAISFAAAPGDNEVNAVLGEGFGESDPAHSTQPGIPLPTNEASFLWTIFRWTDRE